MADFSRRPLKSRDTKLAQKIARRLSETAITPNQISAASVGFAALAGLMFWASGAASDPWRSLCLVIAALGLQLRLLCNLFDGMVAVEGGKKTPDGAFWNEAPDRLADILIFAGMGLGAGAPALGWAAAALAVLTAYLRELGNAAGPPADFSGPMAKPQRMAAATAAAMLAIPLAWLLPGWNILEIALWLICVGAALTALRRSRRMIAGLRRQDGGH